MKINSLYSSQPFQTAFQHAFKEGSEFVDQNTGAHLRNRPFQVTVLPNIFPDLDVEQLREEILSSKASMMVHRKNDLHDFYQSGDLRRSYKKLFPVSSKYPLLRELVRCFVPDLPESEGESIRRLVASLTGTPIDGETADIACQIYSPGSYLLCHDDALEGRLFAWVFYLSSAPLDITGGSLELFGCERIDKQIYPTIVVDKVIPQRNTLMFFPVSEVSFHAVAEVLSGERVSVAGWFYASGSSPYVLPKGFEIQSRPLPSPCSVGCLPHAGQMAAINKFYESSTVLASIARVLKNEDVVSLTSFFDSFTFALDSALFEGDCWKLQGPPNHRQLYELVIEPSTRAFSSGPGEKLAQFITYIAGCSVVRGGVVIPKNHALSFARIYKFVPSCYQVIHDDFQTRQTNAVDVLFFHSEHDTGTQNCVRYASLTRGNKKREDVVEIDPGQSNTVYFVAVKQDTQISVDYLTQTSSPFLMFWIRFAEPGTVH